MAILFASQEWLDSLKKHWKPARHTKRQPRTGKEISILSWSPMHRINRGILCILTYGMANVARLP